MYAVPQQACAVVKISCNACCWGESGSLLCVAGDGSLSTDVFSPGFSQFQKAKPGLRIESDAFSKALFDIFLSPESIVQDGRKKWTASALAMAK